LNDRLDIDLHDVLAAETAMVTALMITANHADVPMCLHTIDAILRVSGRTQPHRPVPLNIGGTPGRRVAPRPRPWSAAS
jgi:hypothetical protein